MRNKILYILFGAIFIFSSCVNDLDTLPLDPQSKNPEVVYADEANYFKGLAKIYSTLAMSGQDGIGSSDIEGMDAGNTQLYRCWFNSQVLTTDEAINAWGNDPWVSEINQMTWTTTQNEVLEGLYQRGMLTIALVNEYLSQTTDDNMSKRGIRKEFWSTVHTYRAEAKALRALMYYMLMDSFARPPFITEENFSSQPGQISRAELFSWITTQLEELGEGNELLAARANYGRVDKGFIYALLSRLYLNAEVYTGEKKYDECIAASKKVIDMGYDLSPEYAHLFMADNDITSAKEIIFPIEFKGATTASYGGSRYLIVSSRGDYMTLANSGLDESGWGGSSALETLVKKFEFTNPNYSEENDTESIKDKRGIFFSDGSTLAISHWNGTFKEQGWKVHKYTNLTSTGAPASNTKHPDTDIPFFRLGEIYLNYAEAVKRGGAGGSEETAVRYINELRKRGYGDNSGKISAAQMTLDFLLEERSREMYWEGTRRSDLVRYNNFTSGSYLWPFKGGLAGGGGVEEYKNIFPIPTSDLSVNGNLTQNTGY